MGRRRLHLYDGFCTLLNPSNVRRSFNKIIASAGVPQIRIHDLRHTHITLAIDSGVDAEVVANRPGQDVTVTMKIYSQVTDTHKRKAARNMEDLLSGNQWHLRGTYRDENTDHSAPPQPN